MLFRSIPIPVELGQGIQDISSLTWEMLVAGMLRLLAHDPANMAADYYRRFIRAVKPDIVTELSSTGVMKARNGDLDVAEEVFLALSGLDPEAPEPILNLAILNEDRADRLESSGKEELADAVRSKAWEGYRRLMTMEPAYPDAFFNAGFFHMKNHEYDQALRMFETYCTIGDDDTKKARATEIVSTLKMRDSSDSLFKEAYDFIRMGRDTEGLDKATRFVEDNPEVWNGWFLVGWARRRLRQWQEGRESFLKALELGGEGVDILNELAICEMELGMLHESRQRLEQALRQEPENVKIISNLGVVAQKQGRDEEAAGFWRTVLELDPSDTIARRQLEDLG